MSAFGGKADIGEYVRNVRFTPKSGHWVHQGRQIGTVIVPRH
jgi:hypothetical protein